MRQCLVTGGAGFIGSHLVEGILAKGWRVRVLDDFSSGNPRNVDAAKGPVEVLRGSITRQEDADKAVAGCDFVFHLAALPSVTKSVEDPLLSQEICDTGTLRVLDAARRLGVKRVVYAGSSSAYGDQPGEFRKETDPLLPLSPYAAAKLSGEHYCSCFTAAYGLETVRLRFFNVFGPRQDAKSPYSGVIALFLNAMLQGKTPTIYGDGLQARDFVYVKNVVEALLLAAEADRAVGGVYNIGMGQSITILDLVSQLNELLGSKVKPKHEAPRAGDIRFSCADITRARQDLGFDPKIAFREGLSRTMDWVRNQG